MYYQRLRTAWRPLPSSFPGTVGWRLTLLLPLAHAVVRHVEHIFWCLFFCCFHQCFLISFHWWGSPTCPALHGNLTQLVTASVSMGGFLTRACVTVMGVLGCEGDWQRCRFPPSISVLSSEPLATPGGLDLSSVGPATIEGCLCLHSVTHETGEG